MPRAVDPSTLSRGGGLAAARSVEASSFVHPTQGLDGLVAHVVDPSRAHMAETIGVVDAGALFTSDEVEGALQELASSHAVTSLNGVVQGCTYSSVGLTITLATPSLVLVNGTERTLSGQSIALADNQTNWVYVHGTTGVLSVLTGASPPSFTSPEHVLLHRIVATGGTITATRDARWFVKNLDRKLPLTIRASGTEADRNSEAAFESIDAAMLYLENFGSGVMRTFTLIIKGALTVSTSITIPVDGVTLQGEDGCTLTTGASLAPMIDLSGRSNIRIRDIQFVAAHASSVGVGVTSSGAMSNIVVERCVFSGTGGQNWVSGVDVNLAGPQTAVFLRESQVTATTYGVRLREPVSCRLDDLVVIEAGSSGTAAVHLGFSGGGINGTTDCQVRGVSTTGFATSLYMRGTTMRVQGCSFSGAGTGIWTEAGSDVVTIANTLVSLGATRGVNGIIVDGDSFVVQGCQVVNPRNPASYAAQVPTGISVTSGSDLVTVEACRIDGFLNTVTPGGYGIRFVGSTTNSVVSATTLSATDTGIGVAGPAPRFRVVGCTVDDVQTGLVLQADASVSNTTVNLSSSRGLRGMSLTGANIRVSGCRLYNPRAAGSYGGADVPTGILLNVCTRTAVTGTEMQGFFNSVGNAGAGIAATGGLSTNLTVDGCTVETAVTGIDATNIGGCMISNSKIGDFETGIYLANPTNTVTGCALDSSSSRGLYGIRVLGLNTSVANCVISNARAAYTVETPYGVRVAAERVAVTGCTIGGWQNTTGSLGAGVYLDTNAKQVLVHGNNVDQCWNGVLAPTASAASALTVSDNAITRFGGAGVTLTNSEQVKVSGNTLYDGATGSLGILVANGTDVDVVGNQVNCGSLSSTGIQLEGTNTSANRLRRFTVANNNVRAFTSYGIRLSGYVQNGVVSGNHLDGQLSAGDPSAVACIGVTSASTDLAKYVEITGNTCWRARSGVVVTGVSATNLVSNVAVVGNNIHHCAVGSGGNTACHGVYFQWVVDSTVSENVIANIGQLISDNDVVSAPTAGPNVYPYGVLLSSTLNVTVSSNEVVNAAAAGAGVSYGISVSASSNANPNPVTSRAARISGNRILASDTATPISVGIAIGVGQTVLPGDTVNLTGLLIEENVVRRTTSQSILMLVGGGALVEQVSITDNVCSETTSGSGDGIAIVVTSGTDFPHGILREVLVAGNNVGNAAGSGIYVSAATGCTLTTLTIRGNTITDVADTGIEVEVASAPSAFGNVTIDGNTVAGAASDALVLTVTDLASTENVSVSGNAVTASGGGAAAAKGIVVSTLSSGAVLRNDLVGFKVDDNRLNTAQTGLEVVVTGVLRQATFSGNLVTVTGAVLNSSVTMSTDSVVLAETFSRNIVMDGNAFTGGREVTVLVDNGQKLTSFSFTNNVFHTMSRHGFSLQVDGATVGTSDAVSDVTVANNAFKDVAEQALQVILGPSGAIDTCSGIAIRGNQFHGCNTTGTGNVTVLLQPNCVVRNYTVEGNTFASCGTFDGLSGVVTVQLGVAGAGTSENIVVSRNTFYGCSGPAVYVVNAAAVFRLLSGVRVDGNTVSAHTYTALYLDFSAFSQAQSVSVSDNLIENVSGAGSDVGIIVSGPNSALFESVSVCRNKVRNTGAGASGAITVNVNDDADNLVIDGNTVDDADASSAAIFVPVDGLWRNGSVSGNTISNAAGGAILLNSLAIDAAPSGFRAVAISDNRIRLTTGRGIQVAGTTGAGSTSLFENLLVADNVLEQVGSVGIDINAANGTSIDGLAIRGNTLRTVTSDAIYVSANGVSNAENVVITGNTIRDGSGYGIRCAGTGTNDFIGLGISDNNLLDIESHGISVLSTNIRSAVISDNCVRNWSTDAAATNLGGIFLLSGNTQNVVVSGNVLRTDQADAIALWFLLSGTLRTFCVSDNVAHLEDGANTESMRFDTLASADQLNVSITGNSFRGAATGVNRNGSSFAPDRSVCANNNERTTGGAGLWSLFVTPFTANCITTPNQD